MYIALFSFLVGGLQKSKSLSVTVSPDVVSKVSKMKNSPLPRPGFDFFIHRFDFIFGLVAAEAGPIFPLFHQLPPPQVFRNAFSGVGRAFRRKSGEQPNASTEALLRNDEEEEEKTSPLFWVESTKHSKSVFRCVKICSQEKKKALEKQPC